MSLHRCRRVKSRAGDLLSSLAINKAMRAVFNRRSFLPASGRAALGWPLLSLAACTRRDSVAAVADDGEWRTLIEYVEKEIPSLLDRSATTPGAAIALVADAQLLWSRGFGVTDRTTTGTCCRIPGGGFRTGARPRIR